MQEKELKTHITKKGYIRDSAGMMQHRRVWRKHNGPVPVGFFIHHKNENKKDNNIENLELITTLHHKRIHSGCELRDGKWWKPCRKCGVMKEIESDYYKQYEWVNSWCKKCCIEAAVNNKRKRKDLHRKQ